MDFDDLPGWWGIIPTGSATAFSGVAILVYNTPISVFIAFPMGFVVGFFLTYVIFKWRGDI